MKLLGIPVKVEGSFFFLAFILAAGRASEPVLLVEWLLVVFISILLHEFGHAFAGRAFGLQPKITLYSMGGLTSWRVPSPLAPLKNFVISLAGPATGFVIGALVYLGSPLALKQGSTLASVIYADLLWVNVGWGVFNLLPVLPLDGGQALRSLEALIFKRREQLLTPAVSLLVSAAIMVWAFSARLPWIAFLGGWFAYSNGSFLFKAMQTHRERTLRPRLEEAGEALNAHDYERACAVAAEVLKDAKTDALKRHASALLVFSLAQKGEAEAAERELRRHQAQFGTDSYLQGVVLLKAAQPAAAVPHLRATLEASPRKEFGLVLFNALTQCGQWDEALDLCEHTAFEEIRRPLYLKLQDEAFKRGAFKVSAFAGAAAYRESADAEVAFNVACAHAREGNRPAALAWLRRAVESGFENRDAFDSDPDIESIRGTAEFDEIRATLSAPEKNRG